MDISLFVIDSQILNSLPQDNYDPRAAKSSFDQNKSGRPNCQVLCINGKKITHLAILNDLAPSLKLQTWIQDIKENKGFEVITLTKYEPSLVHRIISVPTYLHLLIFDPSLDKDTGYVLHISILYDLAAVTDQHYWFRGPMEISEADARLIYRQGVRKSHFSVTETSTIYKAVEIIPLVIDGLVLAVPRPASEFTKPVGEYLEFIECNRTQAELFDEMYSPSQTDLQLTHAFRVKVKKILSTVKNVLDKLGVEFWLSSGTLLGYFRQCDVIYYSKDVDIGIKIENLKPNLIEYLQMADLQLIHQFGQPNDSFEVSFRNEDIKLDIFFFYLDHQTGHTWSGGTDTSNCDKTKYLFAPFGLCWTEFLGRLFRIPCPTLPYIEANYGKNGSWFKPSKEWHWKHSPPNAIFNGRWPESQWSQVIRSFNL